jgi:hypothetical protein
LGGEIVAAAAISADEDGAKRRPQAAGRRSRLLDLIEVNPAVQQGKAIKTAIMTITTL